MGTPYETKPEGGLLCPNGAETCFAIDFPSRVTITKIFIIQTGGTADDFTVNVFNSEDACDDNSLTDADGDALDNQLFRVCAELEGVQGGNGGAQGGGGSGMGELAHFFEPPVEFYSQDPPHRLGQNRKIYVRIAPDVATDDCTYCLVIGGFSDII